MKLVKVLIPFHLSDTKKDYVANDKIEVTDEQLTKIKAVNVNMVEVLGEVEEKPKKKATKK